MNEKPIVTTVLLDARTWRLLHELALLRAERLGGRPSQSAVIREAIDAAALKEKGAQ